MVTLCRQFEQQGYEVVEDPARARIIVINSCSVTAHTEAKTRRFIEAVARRNPGARILVTGCLAQQKPYEMHARSGVAWVVGNSRKCDIVSIVDRHDEGVFHESLDGRNRTLPIPFLRLSAGDWRKRTRFPVKIQEGCDCACTYCIVPALRGPSRSADRDTVLRACMQARDAGFKEIVLTGTHIGQYAGASGGLPALLESILSLQGDFRLRLSSLDPRELSPALTELIAARDRICPHLHISIQSFAPEVLAKMGRPYSRLDVLRERLELLRERVPDLGLGGDFIVGFPGESAAQFEQTLRAVVATGFTYGHVFRFSRRPGTPAATMPGEVDEKEKRERARRLRECLARSQSSFVTGQQGRIHRIIVEYEAPVRGVTANYLRVEAPGRSKRNTWLSVALEDTLTRSGRVRARVAESEGA